MNYKECVLELEQLEVIPTRTPSLDVFKRALLNADLSSKLNPQQNIIIAGTNGKGSTAATLSRLLCAAGKRVGLYTSPHLVTTRERIRVNDEDVDESLFCQTYKNYREIIHDKDNPLTHFESLTLLAVVIFYSGRFIQSSILRSGKSALEARLMQPMPLLMIIVQ